MKEKTIHVEAEKAVLENIVLVPYHEKYCESVIRIGNEMFGEGYFSAKKLNALIAGKHIFCVALIDGEAVGYCLLVEEGIADAEKLLMVDAHEIVRRNGGDSPICLIKSMAIDSRYQRRGIARKLFTYCYNKCLAKGYHSAWGSAWKIGDSVAMQKLFDAFEFVSIAEIPDIWYDDEDYKCVICGGRCRCTGVIFVKSF